MRPEDDPNGYVYTNIPWRYSGIATKFFGVDPLALLVIPLAIFGLRQGWGWFFMVGLVALGGLFVFVSFKGYPSMRVYLQSRAVKYIGRARWKTR